MASIPKKVVDRFSKTINKFQAILTTGKARDINESNTVSIISDMLAEIFGYDKYLDVTSEFCIRGTYCDLAIKIDNKIQYLIEAKAIGIDLKENHLRQVIDYGANLGAQWVILTNGIVWEIYKIRFEKPINYSLICGFNFLELNSRKTDDQEKLFLLSKEGLSKDVREDYHEKSQTLNRFTLGALLLTDDMIASIRRELKKLSPGTKIEPAEISLLLQTDILKRDVLEGADAAKAQTRLKRFYNKTARPKIAETTSDESAVADSSEGVKI